MSDTEAKTRAVKNDRQPKIRRSTGVVGIGDPKWIAVALLYVAAVALMAVFGDV